MPNAGLLLLGDCSGHGPVAVRGKCRDPDLKPRVSVARSFSTEQPHVGVEGSSLGRIDVGLQTVRVVVVVDVEKKPRLRNTKTTGLRVVLRSKASRIASM